MEPTLAAEKLREAEEAFLALEARLRDGDWRAISPVEVERVRADLDAAVPALEGSALGRALLLKALCGDLRIRASLLDLSFALEGRAGPIAREALEWLAQARVLFEEDEPDLVARVDDAARYIDGWIDR